MGVDAAELERRNEAAIERLRMTAQRIGEDPLAFSVATEARNILEVAEDHRLSAACAALETAITAALPARLAAYAKAVGQHKAQRGFHVQVVGGRGEPLPLPSFAYTDGLADHGHPELVIVGMPIHVAAVLLEDLGAEVLEGKRTLHAGEDLDGLLIGDYKLRVIDCPGPLLDRVQPSDGPVGALQLLVPDRVGRFPGDLDVDAKFADAQQYPDYAG
jgi:hypothetical protein